MAHAVIVHAGPEVSELCLQILRVIPYSATQLYSYEVLKRMLRGPDGQLSLPARFTAGGCAGILASLVRQLHPQSGSVHAKGPARAGAAHHLI